MTRDPAEIESKYAHNGKVMVGTAILLLIIIIIIIFFHTYIRFCRRRRRRLNSHSLPANSSSAAASFKDPLDPSVIKSLPTFTFSAANHRTLHDCAVCLSDFADGDEGRMLPNCNHAFHAHCIDTWFASHSTCPLCRSPVQPATRSEAEPGSESEPGEGSSSSSSSSLPAPIACPRKPLDLDIIIETPEMERGSDTVTGEQGFKWSLKKFCNV